MCKKWAYYVRSVSALCCIFCMLFLSTLHVNAQINDITGSNLFSSTAGITNTLTLYINPDYDALDISSATYSGTSSGTNSATTGSYSGSNGSTSGSYSGSVASHTVSIPQISINGGSQSFRVSGTMTSSSFTGTGTLTLSNLKTYSASATENSASESGSFSISSSTESGDLSVDASTISTNDTGTISLTTTHGGSTVMHFHIPYFFGQSLSSGVGDLDLDKYYRFNLVAQNFTSVSNIGHVSNIAILDGQGNLISSRNAGNYDQRNCLYLLGSQLYTYDSNTHGVWGFQGFLDFDFLLESINQAMTLNITPAYTCSLYLVKDSLQSSVGTNVTSDTYTHKQLEISNETQSDTNTTTHSIFDSISSFFGSFFSNLIGVFVPEDGYFTTWFNRVNTLLTDKLGILYYPFSVIIDIFTRLNTALSSGQSNSCPIVIPELGISIQGSRYVFLESQTIDLIDYDISLANADTSNSSMFNLPSLIWVIRRFTSTVFIIAFLNMCVNKVKLILRGSEEA